MRGCPCTAEMDRGEGAVGGCPPGGNGVAMGVVEMEGPSGGMQRWSGGNGVGVKVEMESGNSGLELWR